MLRNFASRHSLSKRTRAEATRIIEEARETAAHYEAIRAGLGADFRAELDAALARIRNNPLLYAAESGTIRVCLLHRFPYSVFYEDLSDRIWVAAVLGTPPPELRRASPNLCLTSQERAPLTLTELISFSSSVVARVRLPVQKKVWPFHSSPAIYT